MLALLGWNPGTEQELFSMEELVQAFSLERVGKSGSRFDPEKARWFNHIYLQKRSDNQLAIEFREYLRIQGFFYDIVELETLVGLVKERVSFVSEIWQETEFFFRAPVCYDQVAVRKRWKEDSGKQLGELRQLLAETEDFSKDVLETAVREWIERNGYGTGAIMNVFRLVIVGALRGPHMFDIITWIGREETLNRIDKGLSELGK